jgi:hypothetical protein
MFKRTMAVAIAITIAAEFATAQVPCSVGLYADAGATSSVVTPDLFETFDVYVVLFVEGLANAVSYGLQADGLGTDYELLGALYGPDGEGLNIPLDGENVGLGTCAIGFNGAPIVVTKYSFFQINALAPTTSMSVVGGREDPDFPVFSDCTGQLTACVVGPTLTVDNAVSGDSDSFGAVKSLFRR